MKRIMLFLLAILVIALSFTEMSASTMSAPFLGFLLAFVLFYFAIRKPRFTKKEN